MKMLLLIPICLLILLGCGLINSTDNTERFIPGTYLRFSSHEYGKEYDTLVITLQNESAHEFKICRRWKYERVLDKQLIEPEYKVVYTTGIYYGQQKAMRETETGTLYSFDVKEKLVFNGSINYKKL
jgi:hypothetical protein